jgi:hypothetical protein
MKPRGCLLVEGGVYVAVYKKKKNVIVNRFVNHSMSPRGYSLVQGGVYEAVYEGGIR